MNRKSLLLPVLIGIAGPAGAGSFCVGDSAALALALDIADNNGLSDSILIQQGTYVGNFVYNANAAETGSLTVEGGYDPGCATRTIDPANTVLQGAGGRTLRLDGNDNSDLRIDGLTIRDGRSELGGAGLDIGRWIDVEVTHNLFTANRTVTGFDGSGGLNIDRSTNVTVAANRFVDNTGGKGGAMSLSDPVLAHIEGNFVVDNFAEQNGGGIDGDSAGRFVLTNNIVARNGAGEDGGGIGLKLSDGGSAALTNNTVTLNTAVEEAGGVEFKMIGDAAVATIYNNIVYANSSTLLGRDLFIDNDDERNGIPATVELFNNDFDHSFGGLFMAIPFAVDASNLNNVDPLFSDAPADDFSLQSGSPLIDAGTVLAPELPAQDYSGAARVAGPAPDLGALEHVAMDIDTDGDGIVDSADNCTLVANPLQIDTNGDGFGNRCDADLNNDGQINFADLALIQLAFFSVPASPNWNPDADFNNDNAINFADLVLVVETFFGSPGPSGIAP